LRDGAVDLVGGSAHSALSAFPQWKGAKLLCAQAQGMYWFLVMHRDLGGTRGDIGVVKGRSIGAAPWVDIGLRRLLIEAGIDLARDKVTIAPVPGALGDLNLIDYDGLSLGAPFVRHDLPAGGRRLLQKATGYVATIKGGSVTFEGGQPTGELPGRLVRGAR